MDHDLTLPRPGAIPRSERHLALAGHSVRLGVSLVSLGLAAACGSAVGVVVASVALHLALFGLSHDQVHGALALGPRSGRLLLSVTQALMLGSGHGTQLTHRVHHARPLAPDDSEGAGARRSLLGAGWRAIPDALHHRREGLRLARGAARRWVLAENLACAVLLALGLASGLLALQLYLAVSLGLQLSSGLWAAWLPHHAPAWLLVIAKRLSVTPSLVMRSLAHHDLHHARPDLPAAWLR
jgi:hypothetical protein